MGSHTYSYPSHNCRNLPSVSFVFCYLEIQYLGTSCAKSSPDNLYWEWNHNTMVEICAQIRNRVLCKYVQRL